MRGREREERVQELLDGLLGPAEEACVRSLVESDPEWSRSHRSLQALHALLDTPLDVQPPADLAPAVLKAVTTDRARRAFRFRLPARVENALALAGTAGLAVLVLGGPRVLGPEGLAWLGRGIVAATDGLVALVDRIGTTAVQAAHLDWIARLLATLSEAARTVLTTSAEPLAVLALLGAATTLALVVTLNRAARGTREGGWRHAHLLA